MDRVVFVEARQVLTLDEIDLSDIEFWARPWAEREGAFQLLRRERPLAFFEEPELPEDLALHRGDRFVLVATVILATEILASGFAGWARPPAALGTRRWR